MFSMRTACSSCGFRPSSFRMVGGDLCGLQRDRNGRAARRSAPRHQDERFRILAFQARLDGNALLGLAV